MHVWLLHPAEPVPLDGDVRLFRYGTLSQMLADRGHQATQWASTFNHFTKTQRSSCSRSACTGPGYQVELLYGRPYRRHVSWSRIQSQRDVAAGFSRRAAELPRPDVIVVSLPTLELASAVLNFAQPRGIPTLVDIRDLWPDVFLTAVPEWVRPAFSPLLWGYERQAIDICRRASRLTGVSRDYLAWGLRKANRAPRPGEAPLHLAYRKPELTDAEQRLFADKWEPQGVGKSRVLRCCFFGTLGQSAGLRVLCDTARVLTTRGHGDIEFIICGSGPREDELHRLTRHLPQVRHLGRVNSREIAWLMQRCDVGIATYEQGVLQSLPNKPIEYLAGGLPVLTTLQGELSELLARYDCGRVCGVRDAAGMADWLVQLKQDAALRQRLSQNASRLFQEQFDAARIYRDFIDELSEFSIQLRGQAAA